MAAQTSWSGFLKVSLVSCPVRLYPVTTRANRISFHNLDEKTHNRIEMVPHDAETGEEVDREELVRGYEVEKGRFVLVEKEELQELQIESSRTVDLDRFVPCAEIDPLYYETPYLLAPDGPIADEAYRVIHAALLRKKKVGIGRVVLSGRERLVAVEPRGKGLLLTTLRAADEVREAAPYFAEIGDGTADAEMVELATKIVERRAKHFDPTRFDDRYQTALAKLVSAKMAGETPVAPAEAKAGPAVDLMAALKRSLQQAADSASPKTQPRRKAAPRKAAAKKKAAAKPARRRA